MQHGIDAHQQFARHGDHRLVAPFDRRQPAKGCLQGPRHADGVLGILDQNPAQVAAALVSDASPVTGRPALVDAGGEPRIADQLLSRREARNLADLRQDEQRREASDAGNRESKIVRRFLRDNR